ncbi:MAG: cytochrome P450 [Pseudonocardiaceae bacterium]
MTPQSTPQPIPQPAPRPPRTEHGIEPLLDWLAVMRQRHRVWRDDHGVCHVFRYEDVRTVLHDWRVFSSDRSRLMPGEDRLASGNLTMMDPPQHRKLRSVVNQVFTPRMVDRLAPRVTEIAVRLLDEVDAEQFDVIECLAHPLPVIVIAELLGVPVEDRELFRTWSAGFGAGQESALRALHEYLLEHCAQRRTTPREDLVTRLLDADVDGRKLDDDEVASMAGLFLLAGHLTTTMLLSSAVQCLMEDPQTAGRLRADAELLPAAVTEVLRYRPPFTQVSRVTTSTAELGSTVLPQGSLVIAWTLSANHDERYFADPGRFDIGRPVDRQLSFGHGIHFCLGAQLARLETGIALRLLLERFTELSLPAGTRLRYYEAPVFGSQRLPVRVRRAELVR